MKKGFPFSLLLVSAPRHPYQTTGERIFALIAANADASDEMSEFFAGERGEIESGLVSTPAGDVPLRKVRLSALSDSARNLDLEHAPDGATGSKDALLAWEKRVGAELAKTAGSFWLASPNADWAVLSAETRPHRMDWQGCQENPEVQAFIHAQCAKSERDDLLAALKEYAPKNDALATAAAGVEKSPSEPVARPRKARSL